MDSRLRENDYSSISQVTGSSTPTKKPAEAGFVYLFFYSKHIVLTINRRSLS
jgi:hypothetical protein